MGNELFTHARKGSPGRQDGNADDDDDSLCSPGSGALDESPQRTDWPSSASPAFHKYGPLPNAAGAGMNRLSSDEEL